MPRDKKEHDAITPTGPMTFSLGQMLGIVSGIAIILGLTSQLRAVGFFLGLYLSVAIVGWSWKQRHLVFGGGTAFTVFVLTYAAAWVQLGYTDRMERDFGVAAIVEQLLPLLEEYNAENGDYPNGLADLNQQKLPSMRAYIDGKRINADTFSDYYGHALTYAKTPAGFSIVWLGRDGKPGGRGLDADRKYGPETVDLPEARLPIRQFLFETRGSGGLLIPAIFASLVAGWIVVQGGPRPAASPAKAIAAVATITAASVAVGVFLATIYVALSQPSNH